MARETQPLSLRLAERNKYYRSHPIDFVRNVIGVEPTEQQKKLILSIAKDDSRVAVKSCTASGKSAVLAWMSLFFLVVYPNCKGILTAPTANQLQRVLKSEIVKWMRTMRAPYNTFYEVTSEKLFIKGKKDTQFFSFVTGNNENTEGLAGLHADKVVIMVDEGSALPSKTFDTLLGTLSYGNTCFALVSNPVRSSGSFYELFQQEDNTVWDLHTFTSYDSPNVDKEWIQEVKDYYGEDSDFFKMRVLGEFPTMDEAQFFSTEIVEEAFNRVVPASVYANFPIVMGVDVARFGKDSTVVVVRQGPKVLAIVSFKGLDTVEVSQEVLKLYRVYSPGSVYVDGIGVGAGVVDQLKRFHLPVVEVVVSNRSQDQKTYFNVRSELCGRVKDWLPTADIPSGNKALRDGFVGINYTFNNKLQIVLESKKDMKKRGNPSPDELDALALTFADQVYNFTSTRKKVVPLVTTRRSTIFV